MKILMVLTSHDELGNTGRKTGFWLEEFAAPYFVFRDASVDITLASPKGGQPPIDPKSDLPENQTQAMSRFKQDVAAQKALSETRKLSEMRSDNFDTIFYVGGHGPMWDLVDNPDSIRLIESFYNSGKPVAAVCHSPGVFHRVMYQGEPLVKGKRVTGFTNGEEAAVNLTHVVPFLVEDELKRIGGLYEKAADWESFAITDGRVVTGQNPASSTAAAKALLNCSRRERPHRFPRGSSKERRKSAGLIRRRNDEKASDERNVVRGRSLGGLLWLPRISTPRRCREDWHSPNSGGMRIGRQSR